MSSPSRAEADAQALRDWLATPATWTADELIAEIARLKREETEARLTVGMFEAVEADANMIVDAKLQHGLVLQMLDWHELKLAEVAEARRDTRPPLLPARPPAVGRPRVLARGRERRARRATARCSSGDDGSGLAGDSDPPPPPPRRSSSRQPRPTRPPKRIGSARPAWPPRRHGRGPRGRR